MPWEEVERGYEVAKDTYVPITDKDLDRIPLPTVHAVSISDFVEIGQVDPIYLDKRYYLGPDEKGEKAYILLRRALEQTGRAAVAKVTIRDRESLCLVRPYRDALTLETLFYADEVRDTTDLKIPEDGDVKPQELKMAVSLIDNLTTDFDPRRYQDNPGGAPSPDRCQSRWPADAQAAGAHGQGRRPHGRAPRQRRSQQEGRTPGSEGPRPFRGQATSRATAQDRIEGDGRPRSTERFSGPVPAAPSPTPPQGEGQISC